MWAATKAVFGKKCTALTTYITKQERLEMNALRTRLKE